MEKLNLSKDELKAFFNKYDIAELENFKGMFQFVHEYDMTDVVNILDEVYNKKVIDSGLGFTYRIDELNDRELKFLYDITEDVELCLSSIQHIDIEKERIATYKLNNSICEEMKKRDSSKTKKLKKFDISDDELEALFNKFNVIDLEEINDMFQYIFEYDIENIKNILLKVNEQKYREASAEFESFVKPAFYKTSDLSENIKGFTEKELTFFYEFIYAYYDSVVSSRDIALVDYIADLELLLSNIKKEVDKKKHGSDEKIYNKTAN